MRAILLDALGTLVRLEPPAPRLRAELTRRFELDVTEEQAAHAIGVEIAYYRAHLGDGRDAGSLAALRRRCAEALRGGLPAAFANVRNGDLTEALLASLHFSAFADAAPALAGWRSEGTRIVVVSNWDVSLHDVLARVSLAALTDAILTSAEAGARKPAPAIFEQALALAGVPARDAVHVGDSLEEDVAGARAAGVEPVLIARGGTGAAAGPGVRTISTLADL